MDNLSSGSDTNGVRYTIEKLGYYAKVDQGSDQSGPMVDPGAKIAGQKIAGRKFSGAKWLRLKNAWGRIVQK